MKITTWNVNGVRARAEMVLDWVRREEPDVLCLQEIKASPEAVPASVCALEGYWCHWHGHKGYSGVALHLRRSAFPDPPSFVHRRPGRHRTGLRSGRRRGPSRSPQGATLAGSARKRLTFVPGPQARRPALSR